MEPFTESPKKLTGLAKMIGKLKEKLFPTLDSEGSDEVKKSSECQCATVKEQLNEIKTMLEAVQSHIENTQDRSIRRTSEFIKELQRKHRGSI